MNGIDHKYKVQKATSLPKRIFQETEIQALFVLKPPFISISTYRIRKVWGVENRFELSSLSIPLKNLEQYAPLFKKNLTQKLSEREVFQCLYIHSFYINLMLFNKKALSTSGTIKTNIHDCSEKISNIGK